MYKGDLTSIFLSGSNLKSRSELRFDQISNLLSGCISLKVLSQLKHPNIAALYGYCMEGEGLSSTCLVYELATNGSLDVFWGSKLGRERLSSAEVRTRIAYEVATVLRYMHEGLDVSN